MTIWDVLAAVVAIGLVLLGVAYFRWRRDRQSPVAPDDETTPGPKQRSDRTL